MHSNVDILATTHDWRSILLGTLKPLVESQMLYINS